MNVTVVPIVIDALGIIPKGLVKEVEDLRNQRTSTNHPDYSIIENGQYTEKSPGDLRRLVTQTPNASVKNFQRCKIIIQTEF